MQQVNNQKIDFGKLFMSAVNWDAVEKDADKICEILARGKAKK